MASLPGCICPGVTSGFLGFAFVVLVYASSFVLLWLLWASLLQLTLGAKEFRGVAVGKWAYQLMMLCHHTL
eukprot:1888706-Amphidinium_carterae.1